ncbi:unnamed protein product [Zymoseptoria tritici ST99CH_3D7]|uniref:Uncharacterized protein n=1 Tax=Zymoseptoria tritici (strain ST99CH_3D7) TaxID=1276538 RepID=A0A1X7S0Z5_ZYMT9|nr:unnamed protein product [Zymoseptoria tritici ST99CH_3D7]
MSSVKHPKGKPLPAVPVIRVARVDSDETEDQTKSENPWRPLTLRPLYIATLILITVLLIVAIQWLLFVSERDQGLIFAKDINELPLRRSFFYLYLPTIISVIYSFLWTWIDLDIKRLEPFFQLSKAGGVSGHGSILLSYPLEFLVTLPFTAFKHKHWSVLSAATVMILVFWGLTPTQSGIFAVRTVHVSGVVKGSHSTSYTPIAQQGNLTAIYAQSVYNIAWLNESLPQFMTTDFVLTPFGPTKNTTSDFTNVTYTAQTTLYSLDVSCEPVVLTNKSGVLNYNTTRGCSFYPPPFRPTDGNDTSKIFDTMYVGYQNENGVADYYLSYDCDERFFHSFFVRWSKTNAAQIESGKLSSTLDPSQANSTALFCEPKYYQQKVNATVRLPSNDVLSIDQSGQKQDLPNDMFNTSALEWTMNSGVTKLDERTSFPRTGFPDQKSHLVDLPLNLAYIPRMAPFAIATHQRPMEDYLDAETLRISYQSAYRLLFARQLADILRPELDASTEGDAQRSYVTQAVVVVPGFAYAATALLSLVLMIATGLMLLIPKRQNNLRTDPASISSIMDLVEGSESTLKPFKKLDSQSTEELHDSLKDFKFHFSGTRLQLLQDQGTPARTAIASRKTAVLGDDDLESSLRSQPSFKGIRPAEMKVAVGGLFLTLQLATLTVFLALFLKARSEHGLALPSESTFVRQLVQNYIPIALATFIEPFWLLLNRLLGLLQPFEELRKGDAHASRSIELDYSSLPPQLLFLRALRSRHWMLMLLCFMVISANVLAVAMGGLMNEGTKSISTSANFSLAKAPRIRLLNGTGLPFNTDVAANWQGGTTSDPFYREMSNLTAGTPLPPWTDHHYGYVPVDVPGGNPNASFQINTWAFGAKLKCDALSTGNEKFYNLTFSSDANSAYLTVPVNSGNGTVVNCTNLQSSASGVGLRNLASTPGHSAMEINTMLSSNSSNSEDLYCRQHIFAGWIRADWQVIEGEGDERTESGKPKMQLVSSNETMILCSPLLIIGEAEIVVDHAGHVQKLVSMTYSSAPVDPYFASGKRWDLVAQANQFLTDSGSTWHNDSNPSDFVNYLIAEGKHDSSLLDPKVTTIWPDSAAQALTDIYEKLFAILIGSNADLLFEDVADQTPKVAGFAITPETRILFSTPAFVVTEAILGCYILVTIFFYVRRPWRVLPRLPGTVASNIAYVAASRAVSDYRSSDQRGSQDDTRFVRSLWRWGYGRYIGSDGLDHIGIEREPLVTTMGKESWK